jgi:copper(I)-binding protein
MLIGLKNDLNTGGTITVTLHFEKADPLTLKIPIQESAP